MNVPGLLLNDSIYHNDMKESSEESETVTLDSYPFSTDELDCSISTTSTKSNLQKKNTVPLHKKQSNRTTTPNTRNRTTRLPNGILVYITNEIAMGSTDIHKEIQQKALQDSRMKRQLRYQGNTNVVDGKSTVKFTDITVREYPYEIGDNPSSLSGPAITIQWEYQNEQTVSLDQYETMAPTRRKGREMLLPADVRMKILRETGYTLVQIRKETRNVNIARQQRRRTLTQLDMDHVHELSEKITRSTLNVLTFGIRKRKEKEYLSQACAYAI